MTPKQVEKIRIKISKIKKELAADKRRWGGYDDSRGLRYIPPGLFIRLQDYKGALTYFKWFNKNFPDDCGFPLFLFEWALTLFKAGDLKNAEMKALNTFFSNPYLFDKFLGKAFLKLDLNIGFNNDPAELTKYFEYSKDQPDLHDFAVWLNEFLTSDRFNKISNEYFDIERKLRTEPTGPKRTELVERMYGIVDIYYGQKNNS